ncbi:MAG TPA: PAS domain S-box protein, partial [Caulobacteraceae bacterium]|nr:PAS domain S-box protein [Caulobacteraceae bacterium]
VEDVIRDIGERRLASEALVASELKHRLLAERIHDLVVQYDADGIIQYVSPSARRFGYEPEDVVGRSVESFELPEFWEKTRSDLAAYRAGRPFPEGAKTNTTLRLPDGGLACIEGIQSGVYDADGAFAGVLTVQRDVTERMALQADLQQSETRYRLLAEHSPDIIVRYDIAGRLEYVSPAARRYAFEPHELVGRDIGELIHPDEEARSDAYLAGVLSDEEERQGPDVWRIRLPDGEFVSFEGASVGIHDAEGRVTGAVAVLRDVSQRLQLEAELRSKRLEAEAATVAKSEFLANMSHEIRTPLTGVVGFAGLLESMEGLPPAALRYANRISTCAETLVAVVNDVLDFSKLEAGRMELDPHPFDPRELVETAADLVGDRARKKGLEIAVCIKAGHPERLIGDSARLRQVLLNLLTNAVKFTDQGSVRVEARFDAASGLLRVAVADTGVGVPPELADRLFQRFSQVDASSTRVFGGTGLGLAISRALIEMMGGRIGFERNEGQGSTFWLEVPAQPAPEEARVAPPSLSEETVEAMRLLLVDDVAMNRELVSTMLSAFDVDIAQAGSGPEAVKAAMARQFDVILMDVQMPGMDGMAATRAIRANSELNRSTPILAISANVLPEQVAACRDAGMNDHVAKPIDPAELLTKLMRWSPGQLETA